MREMRRTILLTGVLVPLLALGGLSCAQMAQADAANQAATAAVQQTKTAVAAAPQAVAGAVQAVPKTVEGIVGAIPAAAQAIADLPATVQSMADATVSSNHLNWGRPTVIYVTDDQYIVVYPTPQSDLRQGRVRMVVINRTTQLERLTRLQQTGR